MFVRRGKSQPLFTAGRNSAYIDAVAQRRSGRRA